MAFGRIAELHRALVGVFNRAVLREERANPCPLVAGHLALVDHPADEHIGFLSAVLQQMHDRKSDLALAQITANRLADGVGLAREVEQIVDDLKHHAEVESVLAQRSSFFFAGFTQHARQSAAQPANR